MTPVPDRAGVKLPVKAPHTPFALVCLALVAVPILLSAGTTDDYEFTVTDGEATITGYTGPGGDIVIPSTLDGHPVVGIAGGGRTGAFDSNETLTGVVLPDSIRVIGGFAFRDCVNLGSVDMGGNTTTIGQSAFRGCTRLTNIEFPDTITTIEFSAFRDCAGLTNVFIPANVTSIGYGAFASGSNLTAIDVDPENSGYASLSGVLFDSELTELIQYPAGREASSYDIPVSVTALAHSAFWGSTNLTSVFVGNHVSTIGPYAFAECTNLVDVDMGESVTEIMMAAFRDCSNLASITIGTNVASIGWSAFGGCASLTVIEIPASVTSIGQGAFQRMDNLVDIDVDPGNSQYASISGVLFNGDHSELLKYPTAKDNVFFEIPDSVVLIGETAFANSVNLIGIDIPDSVITIGRAAFAGCVGLTDVVIPDSVTSIEISAFARCSHLASVQIGNSVESIRDGAFAQCISLTSIVMPPGVTSIGRGAFADCTNLTAAIFQGNAPSLSSGAFNGVAPDFAVFYFDDAEGFDSLDWAWSDLPMKTLGTPRPFTDWLIEKEVLSAPYTGPASDLNADGVSLLLAYALDLDPGENLSDALPRPALSEDQLTLTFFGDRPGVDYAVQMSTDLVDWDTGGVILSDPDPEGIRTATTDTGAAAAAFLRLVINEVAP